MGCRIGKVAVLAELGAGAGSRVFHVRREADSREYALKVVSVGSRMERKYLAQAKHEFRIGQMLDHPNLVKIHTLETEGGWFSGPRKAKLLIEYAPGKTMGRLPLLPMVELLRVFERIADGLTYLHKQGIYHADLKPNNLIYDPKTGVKVIDYGLAWIQGETKNRVQGTPEYMAPETGIRKLINPRTDVYNFGATAYRLVTLRCLPPTTPGLILDEKSHNRLIVPVESLNPAAPSELCDLIHWCISYNPDRRPQQMSEVQAILGGLAAEWETRR